MPDRNERARVSGLHAGVLRCPVLAQRPFVVRNICRSGSDERHVTRRWFDIKLVVASRVVLSLMLTSHPSASREMEVVCTGPVATTHAQSPLPDVQTQQNVLWSYAHLGLCALWLHHSGRATHKGTIMDIETQWCL
jgi:hypothetical protein